jgi:uncharacterized protein involved in tellurium resistance
MDRKLMGIEKDVEVVRESAAKHEDSMKRWVMMTNQKYVRMSQATIRISSFGYGSDVHAELLDLVSGVCDELGNKATSYKDAPWVFLDLKEN